MRACSSLDVRPSRWLPSSSNRTSSLSSASIADCTRLAASKGSFLRRRFASACSSSFSLSAAKPTQKGGFGRFATDSTMSGFRASSSAGTPPSFLIFCRAAVGNVVIRNCGDGNEYVRVLYMCIHRIEHFAGGLDAHCLSGRGHFDRGRARNQRHTGARFDCRASYRVPHLPRAAIRQTAHRVDRFEGRASGDEHMGAQQQFGLEPGRYFTHQIQWLEHSPHADFAARLVPRIRAEHYDSVLAQLRHIALCSGVSPHLAVHGRRHHQRALASQTERGQQIVGSAVDQFGDEIGRCRSDYDEITITGQLYVRHTVRHAVIPHFHVYRLAGQRLQGQRSNELAGRIGHYDLDIGAAAL